jgi:hypothetical protein
LLRQYGTNAANWLFRKLAGRLCALEDNRTQGNRGQTTASRFSEIDESSEKARKSIEMAYLLSLHNKKAPASFLTGAFS